MNKKAPRHLTPGVTLYIIALLVFAGVSAFCGHYVIAIVEGGVTVALFITLHLLARRRRAEIQKYMQDTAASLNTAFRNELPLPIAVVSISENEIFWSNGPFNQLTGLKPNAFNPKIDTALPDFSLRWLAEGKSEMPGDYAYNGRRYRVLGSQIRPDDEKDRPLFLSSICLVDTTDLLQVHDEYLRSRPIVLIFLIDNYDELIANLPDSVVSTLNAEIGRCLTAWLEGMGGLLRKLERNRYLFLCEAKDLARLVEDKFSVLESIRSVVNPGGIAATLSIGVGKDGATFAENWSFASLSIEMSLSRGGDQAVIKDRYNFTFFGGKTRETERRTKVKSRVIANSLSEIIAQSSEVFIMGHKNADIDAIGAAAGVACLCRKKGKAPHIVVDMEHNAAHSLIDKLLLTPEFANAFMSPEDAMLLADPKSFLIVVDTNRPDQVESKPLLEAIARVAVIDHHRRAADYIEQVVLNLHEPFASSASELVTELLQYAVDTQDILPAEAQALLAGIVLDTKNFSVRTGSRTFEAAAFLRRAGADTVDVKKLFQNNLDDTLSRYKIVQAARLYRGNIAIAALEYTANRTIAAQAADELLNVSGILTSFVLYPDGERVICSARSIDDNMNVQVVLEPLGGGGNAATAGAQISGKNITEVLRALVASIDKFYEE